MTSQERFMLARVKGVVDAYVSMAKAHVRAAFRPPHPEFAGYELGYGDARRRQSVRHLRDMRDIQRAVHEYCKGLGYHVGKT